jgi:hypothetical protein
MIFKTLKIQIIDSDVYLRTEFVTATNDSLYVHYTFLGSLWTLVIILLLQWAIRK